MHYVDSFNIWIPYYTSSPFSKDPKNIYSVRITKGSSLNIGIHLESTSREAQPLTPAHKPASHEVNRLA